MAASSLSEADLHGLVDGHVDPDRRADLLRRAAASPRDRGLVEDWQDQGDWIRDAFAGIVHEPLPPDLDLGKVRHLHAVPFEAATAPVARPRRWRGTIATLAAMILGLVGSWYVAASSQTDGTKVAAPDAVSAPARLPTSTIPDLTRDGFAFVGAESLQGNGLVFHYRRAAGERVDVAVRDAAAPASADAPLSWTSGGASYAMSGSVAPDRLRTLAASLRPDGSAK